MSHAIHKIVGKTASNLISYRGVRRITAKVKNVFCERAPKHVPYFAYARLIARVTFKLLLAVDVIDQSLCCNDLLHELRKSLSLETLPGGQILDYTGIEIDLDLITVFDLL